MTVWLPGRGDDAGHLGSVEQGAWRHGEFSIALIDRTHEVVEIFSSRMLFGGSAKRSVLAGETPLLAVTDGLRGGDVDVRRLRVLLKMRRHILEL